MSFGFAVGDFIAVGKLIGDIASCLQSVGGAKSEYQELIREFKSLDAALRHLDRLQSSSTASAKVDSIKYAALSCRHPLEEFLSKIKKYEKSLSIWGNSSAAKSTADKLRWTFGQKDEIRRLQMYLNAHIGTINILLAERGLECMELAEGKAKANSLQIRAQLDTTRTLLEDIKKDLPAQTKVVRGMQSMLGSLHKLISGDLKASWERFEQIIAKVCISTQKIYTIVVEIRDSIPSVDTRWTYFQEPLIVEDALGLKFPVPSEYDYSMLNVIIRERFKKGVGSTHVSTGKYELCNAKRRSEVLSVASCLVPGTAITMAIIVNTSKVEDAGCPRPRCNSREATPYPGGGFTCCKCFLWYDETTKERLDSDSLEWPKVVQDTMEIETTVSSTHRKRKRPANDQDDWGMLKNVKRCYSFFPHRPWKCPEGFCEYATVGWSTVDERDHHIIDKHRAGQPLFRCLYQPCPYISYLEWQTKQHMGSLHGWEDMGVWSNDLEKAFQSLNHDHPQKVTPFINTPSPTITPDIPSTSTDTTSSANTSDVQTSEERPLFPRLVSISKTEQRVASEHPNSLRASTVGDRVYGRRSSVLAEEIVCFKGSEDGEGLLYDDDDMLGWP